MNRINQKLQEDKKLLSIYFTAGFPKLNDTVSIIQELEKTGVDMIEIGLPFSDPIMDGPVISQASEKKKKNGSKTLDLLEEIGQIKKPNAFSYPENSKPADLKDLFFIYEK